MNVVTTGSVSSMNVLTMMPSRVQRPTSRSVSSIAWRMLQPPLSAKPDQPQPVEFAWGSPSVIMMICFVPPCTLPSISRATRIASGKSVPRGSIQ